MNDFPQLLRCDSKTGNHWLKIKLVGVKSNRSAIGTRVICVTEGNHRQLDEVRSGGSYLSQNDMRLHFGLGKSNAAALEIYWPSGLVERIAVVSGDRIVRIVEGKGIQQ